MNSCQNSILLTGCDGYYAYMQDGKWTQTPHTPDNLYVLLSFLRNELPVMQHWHKAFLLNSHETLVHTKEMELSKHNDLVTLKYIFPPDAETAQATFTLPVQVLLKAMDDWTEVTAAHPPHILVSYREGKITFTAQTTPMPPYKEELQS